MNFRTISRITMVLIILTLQAGLVIGSDSGAEETPVSSSKIDSSEKQLTDPEIVQMPGFPIVLEPDPLQPGDPEPAQQWSLGGATLANLDGIGDLEIVHSYQIGSRSAIGVNEKGRIWAWDSLGNTMPGFPTDLIGGAYQAPSIGDLDGDGDQEIVQLTEGRDEEDDETSTVRLYVLDHRGSVLPGFPKIAGQATMLQGAALYDLDSDGLMEIVVSSDEGVRIFNGDGGEWAIDWQDQPSKGLGIPAIGDVDHDGKAEIFVPGFESLHLFDTDGNELDGWPLVEDGLHYGWMSNAALADLDGDRDLEIVVAAIAPQRNEIEVQVLHHDGTPVNGWPRVIHRETAVLALFGAACSPLVTDFEQDGEFEIVVGSGSSGGRTEIYAWDSSGYPKPGFPYESSVAGGDSFTFMLTAVDYDGDGSMEIFADSSIGAWESDDEYSYIFGIDAHGHDLPGFPLRPRGFSGQNGAIFDDVDNDGDYELASISREINSEIMFVNLYDLNGAYAKSNADWPTYHASNRRGGLQKRSYRGWRYIRIDRVIPR